MAVTTPFQRKIVLGPSVCLVFLDDLEALFPDSNPKQIRKILRALGVPLAHYQHSAMFNLYTLEAVMHFLLRPSGPGISLPRSAEKYKGETSIYTAKKLVTPEDLKVIDSDAMREERAATGAAILTEHLKRPGVVPPDPDPEFDVEVPTETPFLKVGRPHTTDQLGHRGTPPWNGLEAPHD